MCIHIFQNNIVYVSSEMSDRCIQKLELVLHADLFELCAGCRIKLCALTAVLHINLVNIFHQINGRLLADMLVQSTTKIICDIVFSVRKSTCPAKTTHNRTALAGNTALYFLSVDRTFSLSKLMSCLKNRYFAVRILLDKLICSEDTSRSCSNDYHIIIIHLSIASHNTLLFVRPRWRTPIIYDTIFFPLSQEQSLYSSKSPG